MTTTRSTRHIDAPRSAVYAALIDGGAVQHWMVPDDMASIVHEFDGVAGGEFRISLTYDDPSRSGKSTGSTDTFRGTFIELVPDSKVVQSVVFEADDPALQGEMTITYELTDDDGGGTLVTGTHENLPDTVSVEDNETGWQMSMAKLAALVER